MPHANASQNGEKTARSRCSEPQRYSGAMPGPLQAPLVPQKRVPV
jgi:hypothetical protein